MSTQRPEDISEAVVVPGAAAASKETNSDIFKPNDASAQESSAQTPEDLDAAAKSAEAGVVEKVRDQSAGETKAAPINLESAVADNPSSR